MREFGWGRREWSEGKDGGWECGLGAGTWPEMDAGTVGPCLGSTVTELQNWALISTSKTASTFNVQRSTSIPSSRMDSMEPHHFRVYPAIPLTSLTNATRRPTLDLHIIRICTSLRIRSPPLPQPFLELRHRSSLFR